jgi:polar amino acid transport system substrate-binding protein
MSPFRVPALLVALALCAVAVFAAGCGGGNDETTGAEGGGEKLTVGSDVPYPPFEDFGKTKTEFTGFDVELVEAIAKKIGRTPEFQDTSFDTIFRDLAQGKFEMVASATTITKEREESVDFTNPYYLPSAQSIVVIKGTKGIENEKDLEGKIVGVQQGTTGEEYVEEEVDTKELRTYPQGPDTGPQSGHDRSRRHRPAGCRKGGRTGQRPRNRGRDRNRRTVWIRGRAGQ